MRAILLGRISRDEGEDGERLPKGDPRRSRAMVRRGGRVREGFGAAHPSVLNQLEAGRRWCGERGHQVVAEVFDEDYSGTRRDRPGLQAALELAAAGEADLVVVRDGYRLARGHDLPAFLRETLRGHGVEVVSILEEGEVPTLRAFRDLAGAEYVEAIKRAVVSQLRATAAAGRRFGTRFRLPGYRWAEDKRTLEVVPEEAAMMRRAFDLADPEGPCQTFDEIAKGLGWNRERLRSLLRHPFYVGDFVAFRYARNRRGRYVLQSPDQWVRIEDHHPAIVSRELWDRVQNRLDHGSAACRERGTTGSGVLSLSGLLRCSDCGAVMSVRGTYTRRDGSIRRLYRCRTPGCEGRRSTSIVDGARALLDRILEELEDTALMRLLVEGLQEARAGGERIGDLEAEIQAGEKVMAGLTSVIETGEIPDPRALARRYGEVQRRVAGLRASLAKEKAAVSETVTVWTVRDRLRRIRAGIASIRNDLELEKILRPLLHSIVREIQVEADGQTATALLDSGRLVGLPGLADRPGCSVRSSTNSRTRNRDRD